jgi:hypothetical protein
MLNNGQFKTTNNQNHKTLNTHNSSGNLLINNLFSKNNIKKSDIVKSNCNNTTPIDQSIMPNSFINFNSEIREVDEGSNFNSRIPSPNDRTLDINIIR